MVAQVEIHYLLSGSFAGLSIIHFDSGGSLAALEQGTETLMDGLASNLVPDASMEWDGTWVNLNTQTGDFEGEGSTTGHTVSGSATGTDIVAQNASLLVKWKTSGVVNNRRVQGRIFVPLLSREFSVNGQPSGYSLTMSLTERTVWSRPLKDASGTVIREGSEHTVNDFLVGNEFATQGSRRRI